MLDELYISRQLILLFYLLKFLDRLRFSNLDILHLNKIISIKQINNKRIINLMVHKLQEEFDVFYKIFLIPTEDNMDEFQLD